MRIVVVSHSSALGGAERALAELVGLVCGAEHSVTVVLPGDGPLKARLDAAGAATRILPLPWWAGESPRPLRRRIATGFEVGRHLPPVLRLIRQERPDLAVTNTVVTPSLAIAARMQRIPHLWLLHEYALPAQGLFLDLGRRWTFRIAARTSRRLVAASRGLAAEVEDLTGRPCDVLYAAVPTPTGVAQDRPPTGPPYQVLCLGHIAPGKQQVEVVHAIADLRARGVDVRLALVGRADEAYRARLQRLSIHLGISAAVDFVPETPNPGRWFASSHVLVSASRFEVAPRSVAEAMKLGLPVVAADSGGNRELLADGRGSLYPPGDSTALADAIRLALDSSRGVTAAAHWANRTFASAAYLEGFLRVARSAAVERS